MAKGITHVPSNGGKWVYYDLTTGKMLYGERYVNYDQSHAGWYHFDENIGAMSYASISTRHNINGCTTTMPPARCCTGNS